MQTEPGTLSISWCGGLSLAITEKTVALVLFFSFALFTDKKILNHISINALFFTFTDCYSSSYISPPIL